MQDGLVPVWLELEYGTIAVLAADIGRAMEVSVVYPSPGQHRATLRLRRGSL